MNNYSVSGNLTKDPEMRYTANGTEVCNFRIGVRNNRTLGDNEIQLFWDVTCWGATAVNTADLMRQGSYVSCTGDIRAREYTDRDQNRRVALWLNANMVEFGQRERDDEDRQDRQDRPQRQQQRPPRQQAPRQQQQRDTSYDDLPF